MGSVAGKSSAPLKVTDEELKLVGEVIHPNNMLKIATKYLGMTDCEGEGCPYEVLKRWKYRDAVRGEKDVRLNPRFCKHSSFPVLK